MTLQGVFDRVILITLDGVGVGALPDAGLYGDEDANTLGHVAEAAGGLRLDNLRSLGLGNILPLRGVPPVARPRACWGRMAEVSAGKDTTTGHWELAGIVEPEPLPRYPQGFPSEIIARFEAQTGRPCLGNIACSGTDALKLFGARHLETGCPIVYTSADSVFQIAAHEDVIPPEKLYDICRIARSILDPYRIGRVIARPFTGTSPTNFARTPRRRDFSMAPPRPTVLEALVDEGLSVYAVGKIRDIFAGRGVSVYCPSEDNGDGMQKTLEALGRVQRGVIFTNLVDFDMVYGHRRDIQGFAQALEAFDAWLPGFMERLSPTDLLVITADHGCDPTTPGTDHSREYVPLLIWSPAMRGGMDLGVRCCFADVGKTIAEIFGVACASGESMARGILGTRA